jgi:hypothetical protein
MFRARGVYRRRVAGAIVHDDDWRLRAARANGLEAPREVRRTIARGDDDR